MHLSTHDPINKNTAKASLQQMLSVVFSRMEAKDAQLKQVSQPLLQSDRRAEHIELSPRSRHVGAAGGLTHVPAAYARHFTYITHGCCLSRCFSLPWLSLSLLRCHFVCCVRVVEQEAASAAQLESLRQSDPLNFPRPLPPIPEEEPQPEPMPEAVFDIPDSMYPEVGLPGLPAGIMT